jgi:hypothetical protein
LPLQDERIAAGAERYLGVVMTSSRVFGLAAESTASACDGIILTLDDESKYYDYNRFL